MTAPDLDEVADAFARATALMQEAKERLDVLSRAGATAESMLSETKRVNSGLLQVLSALHTAAERAVANQKLLEALVGRAGEEGRVANLVLDGSQLDAIAAALATEVSARTPQTDSVAPAEVTELLEAVKNPPPPPWLPTLHQYMSGSSSLAAEGAVAPIGAAVVQLAESIQTLGDRVQALDDRVAALDTDVFQQITDAGGTGEAQAPDEILLNRLELIEKSLKTLAAKREAPPRAVSEALSELLGTLHEVAASNGGLAATMTKLAAKTSALDKKLAQIDDALIEMAKDIEDVHALAYAAPGLEAPGSEVASGQSSGADVLPQRIRRRLFKS